MPVVAYDLDREVFRRLNAERGQLEDWKGKASGIADYVASWGVERFWAISRSPRLRGGNLPTATEGTDEQKSYFSWAVARQVLCQIVGGTLQINANMDTEQFQERFRQLNFHQQVLLSDVLIEISETIQFWTMRIADARDNGGIV